VLKPQGGVRGPRVILRSPRGLKCPEEKLSPAANGTDDKVWPPGAVEICFVPDKPLILGPPDERSRSASHRLTFVLLQKTKIRYASKPQVIAKQEFYFHLVSTKGMRAVRPFKEIFPEPGFSVEPTDKNHI